jgi:hypothetical protein
MKHGIDLRDHAFTEGRWRATPVWYCVAFGRNLKLAEHLMKRGASPQHSLYAAAYNRDIDAIRRKRDKRFRALASNSGCGSST